MRQPDDAQEVVRCTPTHDTFAHPCSGQWLLQDGRVTFSQMVCLAVLVFVGTQGLKFVASWYDHLRLKVAMQEVVHEAPWSTDTAMISAVLTKAQQLKVPLDPRHLHVERSSQSDTRLWASYAVTLTFPLGFSHTQHFGPEVRSGRR